MRKMSTVYLIFVYFDIPVVPSLIVKFLSFSCLSFQNMCYTTNQYYCTAVKILPHRIPCVQHTGCAQGGTYMEQRNLTLLTDLYELTMMQGYFKEKDANETVVFDMFYRTNPHGNGFAICAGLQQVIEYIEDLHFDDSDIEYLRSLDMFEEDFLSYLNEFRFTGTFTPFWSGTVFLPRGTPCQGHCLPIMQAQLIETALLNIINHQSLIATKTERIVYAAKGDGAAESDCAGPRDWMSARCGARAAMIVGCSGTQCALVENVRCPGKGNPYPQLDYEFSDELTAFRTLCQASLSHCLYPSWWIPMILRFRHPNATSRYLRR